MNQNFIVLNSKGGVGKTFVSKHWLPAFFEIQEKKSVAKTKVIEFESTNEDATTSKKIDFESIDMSDMENINDKLAEISIQSKEKLIFDIGGGVDAVAMVEAIEEFGIGMAFSILFVCELDPVSITGAINLAEKLSDSDMIFVINKLEEKNKKNIEKSPSLDDALKALVVSVLGEEAIKRFEKLNARITYIPDIEAKVTDSLKIKKLALVDRAAMKYLIEKKPISATIDEEVKRLQSDSELSEKEAIEELKKFHAEAKIEYKLVDALKASKHFFETIEAKK